MLKLNKIVKNYLYNVSYQIVVNLMPLITIPYLTRVLGASNLGIERYIESIATMFTTFGLLGLVWYSNRAIAYVRNDEKKLKKCFTEIFLMRVILLLITLCVYLAGFRKSDYYNYYCIFIVYIVGAFLDTYWFFSGIEDMKSVVSCNYIVKFTYTILLFVLVRKPSDINTFIWLTSGANLVSALILLFKVKRYFGHFQIEGINVWQHFVPSLSLFLPQAASQLYVQCDKVMIKNLVDDISQVSFYTENERIVKTPIILATALTTVLMPRIANEFAVGNRENIKIYIRKAFLCILVILLPCCVGLISVASTFVPLYLGEEFRNTYNITIMLCPCMIFIGLSGVTGIQYLVALNRIKELTISYIVAASTNIVLNYILIPELGGVGAAIGTVSAEALVLIIQYYFVRKDIGSLIEKKFLCYLVIWTILMGICVWNIGLLINKVILRLIIQVCIGCIWYFTGMLLYYKRYRKDLNKFYGL